MGIDLEFIINHSLRYQDLNDLPERLNEYFAKVEFSNAYFGGPFSKCEPMLGWHWQKAISFNIDTYNNIAEWCTKEWPGLDSDNGPTLYFAPQCFLGNTGHRWKWITANPIWNLNVRKTIELIGRCFGSTGAIIYPDSLSIAPRPDEMVLDGADLTGIVAQLTKQYGEPADSLAEAFHQKRQYIRTTEPVTGWYFDRWEDSRDYQSLYSIYIALLQSIQAWAWSEKLDNAKTAQLKRNAERFSEIVSKLQKMRHGLSNFQVALLNEFELVLQNRPAGAVLQKIYNSRNLQLNLTTPADAAECLIEVFAADLSGITEYLPFDPMPDIN